MSQLKFQYIVAEQVGPGHWNHQTQTRGSANSPWPMSLCQLSHTCGEGWDRISRMQGGSSPMGLEPTLLLWYPSKGRASYFRDSDEQSSSVWPLGFNTHGFFWKHGSRTSSQTPVAAGTQTQMWPLAAPCAWTLPMDIIAA